MLPSHIGNRDPRPRSFLQDPQLLVDGIPSTALNTRINLNTLCIRRHSRMTRLTPSSYLRQHCPVEMGAAPDHAFEIGMTLKIGYPLKVALVQRHRLVDTSFDGFCQLPTQFALDLAHVYVVAADATGVGEVQRNATSPLLQ